jgi:hypothetical protein
MECYYCRWLNDKHGPGCVNPADAANKDALKATWQQGYDDGAGRREAASEDPTYLLGWVKGDAYADTRENVFEGDYY